MYENLGIYMLMAIVSMVVSMVVTPLMMRFAAPLGMLDKPDHRKVHALPVPRVGGIGIIIGLLIPVFLWLPSEPFVVSFLIGCLVLLIFGSWDDAVDLAPRVKFFGQFIAAIIVVYYGDVYVHNMPFFDEIPAYIGKLFTVFAIVGMINALNLSDGLDGLAGGETLISLLAIGYLAYLSNSTILIVIVASSIGGVFGFLRFNSHPARVFMGDGGSQSLGFILGVLVVYLSQVVNPIMSPVIPLILLGLPVIDALIVFLIRARRGVSLFSPTNDHLHHRLLARGFYHYESVVIIYSLQILFVLCAMSFPYGNDAQILVGYFIACSLVFGGVSYLEAIDWGFDRKTSSKERALLQFIKSNRSWIQFPPRFLEAGISFFLIAAGFMPSIIPADFAISALLLLIFLVMYMLRWFGENVYRMVVFVAVGSSAFLLNEYSPEWVVGQKLIIYSYYAAMVFVTFLAARMLESRFQITTLDYLVVMLMLIIGFEVGSGLEASLVWLIIQMVILFYACEVVIQSSHGRREGVLGGLFVCLVVIVFRGLVI